MYDIDFVITWVDGNDPEWQKQKNKCKGIIDGDARAARYRDWEFLKYWFRAVEKFAPWVHKIYFVTWGHLPKWLNVDDPRLVIVNHKDFIPEEYLPTFSCRPIELNLHRIPGLSEHFVYFNDDMFLLKPVSQNDFFSDGLPRDIALLDAGTVRVRDYYGKLIPVKSLYVSYIYNTVLINRNFDERKSIKQNLSKWLTLKYGHEVIRTLLLLPWGAFPGFKTPHLPYSLLKSTFEEVWEKEPDMLSLSCSHKFRDANDVSSSVFSNWQMAKGTFVPRSAKDGKFSYITDDPDKNGRIFKAIREQKYKMFCINDEYNGVEFEKVKAELNGCFDAILPDKSGFEK